MLGEKIWCGIVKYQVGGQHQMILQGLDVMVAIYIAIDLHQVATTAIPIECIPKT